MSYLTPLNTPPTPKKKINKNKKKEKIVSYYNIKKAYGLFTGSVKSIKYKKIPYGKVMKGHWSQIWQFWLRDGLKLPRGENKIF